MATTTETIKLQATINAMKFTKRTDRPYIIAINADVISYSSEDNRVRVTFRDWLNGRDLLRVEYHGNADPVWVKSNIRANADHCAKG